MKNISRICFILLLALFSNCILAQDGENRPIPVDENIKYGKLENGLTYYIRANKEPQQRASFYIIQNVGSLVENDNQNGLAHFLEHMAFNGTEHFPGKGIISSLEKHGVAFGYNINAYTAFNETVYNLSDVPVDQPGLLDSCLLILSDWSNYLLLTDEEIDSERGVIIEEWRTSRDAGFRMRKEFFPVLLKGSKYPERDIIGDLEILKTFDYNTLRDFYHNWYRTDLQAIAIVGDFDADEMEEKVLNQFSKIPAVKDPIPRPEFEIPEHTETLYVLTTDKEASQNSIDLYIKIKATDPSEKGMDYLREQYIRTLFNSMISSRLNELVQKGIPPFINGSISYSSFLRGYDVYSMGATSKQNQDSLAFDAIYREAERVRRFGFTEGELERAKSNMITSWDSYYKQRDKIDNDTYVSDIQSHYLLNEPLASIDFSYLNVKNVVPTITLDEVSSRAKLWMTKENRVIIVQGPDTEGTEYLTQEQANSIIESITNSDLEPYVDNAAGESLIPNRLTGSETEITKKLERFDAVEWTLGNGARVIFKQVDFEKDNILLAAFSHGGSSLIENEYIPEAEMMSGLAASYGVGEFDNVTLQKMLTGKKASLSISLSELSENINGSSTPQDFETMLQLLYLKFENPRFDREAFDALMSRYESFLAQMNNNPEKVIQDTIALLMSDYNPRTRTMDIDYIKDVEFERIESMYRDRIKDADDFTFFIVGNIDESTAKPLVEKYIGSLSSIDGSEKWVDNGVVGPKGLTEKRIKMQLTVPKSRVVVNFSKELEYNPYNRQAVRIIQGILDLRYNETIREEEGGTYGVSTTISSIQFPRAKTQATIFFDCDPERADYLKDIIYREIKTLYTDGPSQEDLDKTLNNILKNREESKQHNSYWLSTLYSFYYSGIDYNDPANFENILKGFTIDNIRDLAYKVFADSDIIDLIFEPGDIEN